MYFFQRKLTLDWAKAVKAVTKASSSSVSAVFMDTLMMWVGFSLRLCNGLKINWCLQRHRNKKTITLTHSQCSPLSCPRHRDWSRTVRGSNSPAVVLQSCKELHQISCKMNRNTKSTFNHIFLI